MAREQQLSLILVSLCRLLGSAWCQPFLRWEIGRIILVVVVVGVSLLFEVGHVLVHASFVLSHPCSYLPSRFFVVAIATTARCITCISHFWSIIFYWNYNSILILN
jgi:hypothetical protein